MRLYNTLSRTSEIVKPLHPPHITLYCCGPTVYDFTHVGHLRKYTMDDVLRRVLTYLGYTVTHVMNITDVGHLVSDGDEGEDKMEKGARKQGKTVWEVCPMAYIMRAAGGRAQCALSPDDKNAHDPLTITPSHLHQKVGVIIDTN
jgi:cysteinyl-tRNA synthetase